MPFIEFTEDYTVRELAGKLAPDENGTACLRHPVMVGRVQKLDEDRNPIYKSTGVPPESFTKGQVVERDQASCNHFIKRGVAKNVDKPAKAPVTRSAKSE